MADSIESFVEKLQTEGVQAGKDAAEKIRVEAQRQADEIIQQARSEADKILAEAQSQADSALARGRSELALAARDTIHQLRNTLMDILQNVLVGPVTEPLSSSDFLSPLLHDIVMQYARADSERQAKIDINVSPDMAKQLAQWAINELRQAAANNGASVNLRGALKDAGFEYKHEGTNIDVTPNSVIETLTELIGPHFRELHESGEPKAED